MMMVQANRVICLKPYYDCWFVLILLFLTTIALCSPSSLATITDGSIQTDTSTAHQQGDENCIKNNKKQQKQQHCSTVTKKNNLPHILFIVIDDLGSNDLGIHDSGILTPNSDSLARSGIYLSNYYVLPYCSPTRAALLSGRYPLHTGLHEIITDLDTSGLPLDEETLPTVLRRVGYQAHAVGKWHIGHSKWEQTPTYRGFQSFYGYYLGEIDYYTYVHTHPSGRFGYDMRYDKNEYCGNDCSELVDERGNYSTHVYTREAIRNIEEHAANAKDDKPLFLYLAHQAVHYPNEVPVQYYDLYKDKDDWTDQRKTYAGMLSAADESIGNVTRALQKVGMWNNTLVVFTTDNGGPTAVCCVQGSSNGIRRGGKCSVWEGGTTGDAFISGPALQQILHDKDKKDGLDSDKTMREMTSSEQPKGLKSPYLFHVVDWLPTLANLTGAKPAGKPLDGVSQLDAFKQIFSTANKKDISFDATFVPPREELFVGYAKMNDKWYGPAVRYQNWKLLQGGSGGPQTENDNPIGPSSPASGGNTSDTYLLFDLSSDPEEAHDLSAEYPFIVQLLQEKLREYQKSYVPPISHNSSCAFDFPPIINTSKFGPAYWPWCSEVIIYS